VIIGATRLRGAGHRDANEAAGDLFVSLVHLLIAPLVFCTVSMGVARVSGLGRAGRVGLTALLYVLIASTFALLFGLAVGLLVQPGAGLGIDPATLSMAGLDRFGPKEGATSGFFDMVLHVLPSKMLSPFVQGDVIQIVVLAVAFGAVMARLGERAQRLAALIASLTQVLFGLVGSANGEVLPSKRNVGL
jgi:aerobic C4-dicarboxylate transport protein